MSHSLSESSQAPALDRGITLMEVLTDHSPLNLEELSKYTSSPKSSLLRLLETLRTRGWVERDSEKKYLPLVKILKREAPFDWRQEMESELSSLAREIGLTVEWYDIKETRAVITWRYEPDGPLIQVKAKVGYSRGVKGEIDAVAQVLLKCTNMKAGEGIWIYRNGDEVPISKKQLEDCLQREEEHVGCDMEYNTNGVRRIAFGVRSKAGKLLGIIALAEGFTPKADQERSQRMNLLVKKGTELENYLKENL